MPANSRLNPTTQTVSWNRVGPPPNLSSIGIIVMEMVEVLYVQFYFQFENTSVRWLEAPGLSSSYIPYNGGAAPLPLALQNLDALPAGNYKATIYIEFSNAESYVNTLTSVVNLTLTGSPAGQISTNKTTYNVVYNRVRNTLAGDTVVNVLNNNSGVVVFETIGSLFLEKTIGSSFTLEEDPANPFASNSELPTSGSVTVSCRIRKDGIAVHSFLVNILVIATEDISVDPGEFEFVLRKGLNETESDIMTLVNPINKAFTITGPHWINFSQISGNSTSAITLTTLNSEILQAGSYHGNVVIFYDSKQITVPVRLTVLAFSVINLLPYNFCLDDINLEVFQYYPTARFVRVTLEMEINSITQSAIYLIPYFQEKVKTDIGQKIQNYFPIFKTSLFEKIGGFNNELIYKPILTQIKIEELDINYQILHTVNIQNVKFFAGHKPALFPLFTNFGMRRKYKDSVHFFSYFTGLTTPKDFTGVTTADNPTGNFEIQAVALQESEVSYPELSTKMNLKFLDFPEQQKKIVLQWLNNNLVPEWFVFSGDYKITTEFDHSYDSVMIRGEKYDTKDLAKLTINTGFILREEKNLIKEIIRSLSSFIKIEDEVFSCFSITQKLVEKDSTEDLISFDLEFLIVKNGN